MAILLLAMVVILVLARFIAVRQERRGLANYRTSGDIWSLKHNVLWRILKDASEWTLMLLGFALVFVLKTGH